MVILWTIGLGADDGCQNGERHNVTYMATLSNRGRVGFHQAPAWRTFITRQYGTAAHWREHAVSRRQTQEAHSSRGWQPIGTYYNNTGDLRPILVGPTYQNTGRYAILSSWWALRLGLRLGRPALLFIQRVPRWGYIWLATF
jgi:hypothetical protein